MSELSPDTRRSVTADTVAVGKLSRRIAVTQAWLGAALLMTWPLFNLAHPTHFPWHATLHALCAVSMVVVGSYMGHQSIYLLRAVGSRIPAIRRWSLWCVVLSALTIVSGNWAYMPYRGDGGARQRLSATAPFFHGVLMEFKEFICLMPLPLYVGAAFLLWYCIPLRPDSRSNAVIGVLLITAWAFLIAGAVLGISIAKVQFL